MLFVFSSIFEFPDRESWLFDLMAVIVILIIIGLLIRRKRRESGDMQRNLREKVREKTKELEEAKIRAENSEKAKEQFLANMSHEIRTPMNAILQSAKLMLEQNPREEQLKYINAIKHSSDNLLVIINDILDLSKIEAGKIHFEKIDFNLKKEISASVDILSNTAKEKQLSLKLNIEENVPVFLKGDPYRLSQIILNLLNNAIKFTEQGSVNLHVILKEKNLDSAVVEFSIKDTGIGIAKDKLEYIFDMFTQETSSTTRKFGGTGLGLAICKRLIESQNGKISVQSTVGVGSVFTFSIPFFLSDKVEETENQETKENSHSEILAGIKILLAEDNELNQMVAVDILESRIPDVHIEVAKNGKEVLTLIEQKPFDIILMDVQMPEMDGHEATIAIRNLADSHLNSIPIVAMTASVVKAEVDKCFASGMNAFVGKPFQIDELINAIKNLTRNNKSNE